MKKGSARPNNQKKIKKKRNQINKSPIKLKMTKPMLKGEAKR